MSIGTTIAVVFVYILIPLAAFILSFFAHSRFARSFLRFGGMYFGVVFSLSLVLSGDCEYNDFAFQRCQHSPQMLADAIGVLTVFSMVAYFFVAPILAVWSLFREMKIRQHEQFDV